MALLGLEMVIRRENALTPRGERAPLGFAKGKRLMGDMGAGSCEKAPMGFPNTPLLGREDLGNLEIPIGRDLLYNVENAKSGISGNLVEAGYSL